MDRVENLYGRLNDFLHAQKRPERTVASVEWWRTFYRLLREADEYLHDILENMATFDLNERGLEVYETWKSGSITDEEAIQKIRRDLLEDAE